MAKRAFKEMERDVVIWAALHDANFEIEDMEDACWLFDTMP